MSHDMIAQLAAQAAALENQTETVTGGDYEYTPPPAGKTIGRLVEYIEFGMQKRKPYQGKPKSDANEVWVGFELLHPKKNIKEIEIEGEGKKTVADFIRLKLTKSLSDKARFKKLFNTLRYGRDDKTHMAMMLGDAFVFDVIHNEVDDKGTKKVYANIEDDNGFKITAPFVVDPITEERKDVPVPANIRPVKLFLWDLPNKETWDSLFIDGTRTTKVNGKDEEVSKNYIQEKIKSASNYEGSALHKMLAEVPDLGTVSKATPAEDALNELDGGSVSGPANDDDLAALGL